MKEDHLLLVQLDVELVDCYPSIGIDFRSCLFTSSGFVSSEIKNERNTLLGIKLKSIDFNLGDNLCNVVITLVIKHSSGVDYSVSEA